MVQSDLFVCESGSRQEGLLSFFLSASHEEVEGDVPLYGAFASKTEENLRQLVSELWEMERCSIAAIGPTGCGKSTSLAKIIADDINNCRGIRYAVAMPTCDMAQEIYETIQKHVDPVHMHKVAVWSTEHEAGTYSGVTSSINDKAVAASDCFIGTHTFLLKSENPSKVIGERDFLFVDESPIGQEVMTFNSGDIVMAYEWANANGLDPHGAFKALLERSQGLIESRPEESFTESLLEPEFLWEAVRHVERSFRGYTPPSAAIILKFMAAAADRRAFVSWTADNRSEETLAKEGVDRFIEFVFYELPASHFPRTVVMSATADLDGFAKDSDSVRVLASKPRYDNLIIKELDWPKGLPTSIKRIDAARHGKHVDKLLHDCLRLVEHNRFPVLIVAPLHLKNIMVPKVEADPRTYGDQIRFTHYGADLGTNSFMDCQSVIMLANNYLPNSVRAGRHLQVRGQRVSKDSLKAVNNKRTQRQNKVDSMESYFRQYLARGAIRLIDEHGQAAPMTAVVCWRQFTAEIAERSFPGAKVVRSEAKKTLHKKRGDNRKDGFMQKLVEALSEVKSDEITVGDLGINRGQVSRKREVLLAGPSELEAIGWEFVPGERGWGNPSKFIRK